MIRVSVSENYGKEYEGEELSWGPYVSYYDYDCELNDDTPTEVLSMVFPDALERGEFGVPEAILWSEEDCLMFDVYAAANEPGGYCRYGFLVTLESC